MAGSTVEDALAERLLGLPPSNYAPWLDRRPAQALIEREGLPGQRAESWRHTNIRRWYEAAGASRAFGETPGNGETAFVSAPEGVAVKSFADASSADFVAQHGGLALNSVAAPLAAMNALLLGAGAVIRAEGGCRPEVRRPFAEPVRVGAAPAEFQHLLIAVGAGVAVTVIEDPAPYTHRLVEATIAAGGSLTHWRRQGASTNRECSLVSVRIAAGGRYRLAQSSRGADLRRNDVQVTLAGEGAEAAIDSVWRLDGRDHLDNQVTVSHAAGQGFSRQMYRGVAAGQSRAILDGRIHIAAGAEATDASLSAKNLLTSDRAQVFAKPTLEIHASDVKCSHGATVGALDDMAIHYLRSRGIPEDAARALLTDGFLREAIADAEGARQLRLTRAD